MKLNASNVNIPVWKEITVKSNLPKELEKLEELARNIWWAWNYEAREMFQSLDKRIWEEVSHNPVLLLERLSYDRLEEIAGNAEIHGEVKGTLKIAEKLILKATGAITGDVATQSLEIEPNGRFNGQCTMNHPEA